MTSPPESKPASPAVIVASWLLVLVPLGWGVVQSVVKSLPLFAPAPDPSPDSPPPADRARSPPDRSLFEPSPLGGGRFSLLLSGLNSQEHENPGNVSGPLGASPSAAWP
ncbi:MFS transporter small subunit [Tautonia sociabilis]|uniref:Uncharacterized protein n=1 Tax=Tautonia sociabilis TaxID=2080755 RepID=A0A432ME64_9BACT|nr:hypothetical protein [Tautonia sociabilis]RUL83492.1 hypothetical protein TsocGM_21985 [Tautonia sociabilis]